MEKVWLKSYPPGVPAEINPDQHQSFVEILEESFKKYQHIPAFYNLGVTLTYREIDEYSRSFAAFLQQTLQLKKGDRVAIMLPNVLQYPIAVFGAMRAGLVVVNVNPLYTVDELVHQLNDAQATALIVLSNFALTVQQALPQLTTLKHIIISNVGDLFPFPKSIFTHLALKYYYKKIPAWHIPKAIRFRDALSAGKKVKLEPVSFVTNDIAFLQYTGGTTGVAKGAVLTHRNIIANIMQATAWFNHVIIPGEEIIITALPLYHIFSLMANCLFFTSIGGLNILITNPRDLKSMIKEMRKFAFTALTGVNTLFNGLLNHPQFSSLNFSKLKITLGGGMAVQRQVAEKWQSLTGSPLLEAYGLTETAPCVTINPENLKGYNGSIGLPISSTELCFFDNDYKEVPIGQAGEIGVKGPQVMPSYWNNPAETDNVFFEGWFLTGDIGVMDAQGFVRLLERKKDMILVSGFNVYPNEIEDVLMRLSGVKEVAVVSIPDEHTGEAVKAFIVKKDTSLTADQVISDCRQYLTAYKVPKTVEFVDELPKTNVGKILRRALRNHSEKL